MKTVRCLIICVLASLLSISLYSQTKYGLIVAIGEYGDPKIPTVNSVNDIPLIENVLLKNDFDKKNIMYLINEKATKDGIVKTIREELGKKLTTGDIVVIHFSAHGIGFKDFNGDENDGFDETIVCYDTPYQLPNEYKGEKHLVDDEIKILLTELRQKLGSKGQLLVLVDACYSGTIARSNDRFRTFAPLEEGKKNVVGGVKASPNKEKPNGINDGTNNENADLAPCIVISASSQDEPNSETKDIAGNPVGSLSYSFSKAMTQSISNINYKVLFDRIKAEMAVCVPRQTPQAEGNLNKLIFSETLSTALTTEGAYFSPKKYLTDSTFVLDAGGLAEIFTGAVLDLYPVGANLTDSTKIKATGTVISATEFESTVKLNKPLKESDIMASWLVVKAKSFTSIQQKVFLLIKDAAKVQNLLKDDKIIQFVEQKDVFFADLFVQEGKSAFGEYQLLYIFKNIEDTVVLKLPDSKPETIAKALKNNIIPYAKSNYLRAITQVNSNLEVELQIVPISYKMSNNRPIITQKHTENSVLSEGGQIIMKEGTVFILRAINHGVQKAYLNIIDIQPDNSINLLIPDENTAAADISIMPQDTIDFENFLFQISAPYGADMFKLVASAKPFTNLRDIFGNTANRSAASSRGNNSPFEALLIETMDVGTRAVKRLNVPTGDINVYTKVIQVVPEK